MTKYEWSGELMEFGHWERSEAGPVWVSHCVQHPGFAKPCRVCEALPLGMDEGREA